VNLTAAGRVDAPAEIHAADAVRAILRNNMEHLRRQGRNPLPIFYMENYSMPTGAKNMENIGDLIDRQRLMCYPIYRRE